MAYLGYNFADNITDENGSATLANLTPGEYDLIISGDGIAIQRLSIIIDSRRFDPPTLPGGSMSRSCSQCLPGEWCRFLRRSAFGRIVIVVVVQNRRVGNRPFKFANCGYPLSQSPHWIFKLAGVPNTSASPKPPSHFLRAMVAISTNNIVLFGTVKELRCEIVIYPSAN